MILDRDRTVCFTGHRYAQEKDARPLLTPVLEELFAQGYRDFLAGGALGFDTWAALAVLELRKRHPTVRLLLAVPCPEQDASWNKKDRARYRDILRRADCVFLLSSEYSAACMHVRNRFMVENSSVCVAYYNGSAGGTQSTVDYARERGVTVRNLIEEVGEQIQLC